MTNVKHNAKAKAERAEESRLTEDFLDKCQLLIDGLKNPSANFQGWLLDRLEAAQQALHALAKHRAKVRP